MKVWVLGFCSLILWNCAHITDRRTVEKDLDKQPPPSRTEVVHTVEAAQGLKADVTESKEPPQTSSNRETPMGPRETPVAPPEEIVRAPDWLLPWIDLHSKDPLAQILPDQLSRGFEEAFTQKGMRVYRMAEDIKAYYPKLLPFFDFWLVRKLWEKNEFEKAAQFAANLLQAEHPELKRYAEYIRQQYAQVTAVDRYKIGLIVPSHQLQEVQTALKMAFGVRGQDDPFTVVAIEEPQVDEDITKALERLIKEDRVIAIIGGLKVKSRDLMARVTLNYQTPLLYLGQKSGMTQEYPHVFQVGQTLESQVRVIAFDAYRKGLRRFAIIYPNDSFGVEAANLFWDEWVSLGGKITEVATYHPKEKDFQEIAGQLTGKDPTSLKLRQAEYQSIIQDKLKKFPNKRREILSQDEISVLPARYDFDAMFLPDTASGSGKVLATLAYYGLKRVPAYGTSLWFNPQIKKVSGQIWWEHLFFPVTLSHVGHTVEPTLPFVRDFHDRLRKDPSPQVFWAYEGGLILRDTIVRKAPQSRSDLIAALTQSSKVPGLLNLPIYFDEFREHVMPVRIYSFDAKGNLLRIR